MNIKLTVPHTLGSTEVMSFSKSSYVSKAFFDAICALREAGLSFKYHSTYKSTVDQIDIVEEIRNLGIDRSLNLLCFIDLTSRHINRCNWHCGQSSSELPFSARELVLTYPEVHFLFLVSDKNEIPPTRYQENIKEEGAPFNPHFCTGDDLSLLFNILQYHITGFRAWFDPLGLRDALRNKYNEPPKGNKGFLIIEDLDLRFPDLKGEEEWAHPQEDIDKEKEWGEVDISGNIDQKRRPNIDDTIVVIDEEASYLMAHGYSLYRQDGNVFICATKEQVERIFPPNHQPEMLGYGADEKNIGAYYTLQKRTQRYFLKTDNVMRILVSVTPFENERDKKQLKLLGIFDSITKPHSGFYGDLYFSVLEEKGSGSKASKRLIDSISSSTLSDKKSSHSAGFTSQFVAENLLKRAQDAYKKADSTQKFIMCALLCHEAIIILKGETFTTSAACLKLMHQAEVQAECLFSGIHLNKTAVLARIDCIDKTFSQLIKSEASSVKLQAIAAKLETTNSIRKIYESYGHFEEELYALKMVRNFIVQEQKETKNVNKSKIKALRPRLPKSLLEYIYWLVNDFNILFSCMAWIVIFSILIIAGLYASGLICNHTLSNSSTTFIFEVFRKVALTFLSPNDAIYDFLKSSLLPWQQITLGLLSIFISFVGLFHVGILVAMIYSKISRR